MSKKKIAMVAPIPAKPAAADHLEDILASLGNDRPYIVISQHGLSWIVHFEGDYDHSTIKLEAGKWVIK
jgi:hypothetical protein